MARVSVIMATYNCEDTLKRSIESILNQTYSDWEFVICDDCSTDSTYKILQEYKEKYPEKFLILRNEKNSKLPYSLNQCLAVASGEYIARMDADDVSLPERFEKQVAYLDAHSEHAVVGTSMVRFDENSDYDVYKAEKNPNRFTLYKRVPFCHATIMMRKSAYDALNGYVVSNRTERGQDLDLWFRFYAMGFEGNNLDEPLFKVLEDRNAIKRRKFKYSLYMTQTRYLGFKMLKYPISKWYLILTPIISDFVPRRLKLYMQNREK